MQYSYNECKDRLLARLQNKDIFRVWFYFVENHHIQIDYWLFEKFCYSLNHTFETNKVMLISEAFYHFNNEEIKKNYNKWYSYLFEFSDKPDTPIVDTMHIWTTPITPTQQFQDYLHLQIESGKKVYVIFSDVTYDYNSKNCIAFTEKSAYPFDPPNWALSQQIFNLCDFYYKNISTNITEVLESYKKTSADSNKNICIFSLECTDKIQKICFIFVEPSIRKVIDKPPKTIVAEFVQALKPLVETKEIEQTFFVFICPESHLEEFKNNDYLSLFLCKVERIFISDLSLIFNTRKSIYGASEITQQLRADLPKILQEEQQLPVMRSDEITLLQQGLFMPPYVFIKNNFQKSLEVFYFEIKK